MGIAICPVPEQKTVKHRVHIDVHTDSVDTVLALGATVAPGYDNPDDPWTVLLDPEGGELCAFVRDDVPAYRTYELCVDAVDGEQLARWWADVFGVEPLNQGRSYWWIEGVPGMPFELMVFDPCRSPRRSRTASTGTCTATSASCSPTGPPTCGTSRAGRCSRTPRATSSASSRSRLRRPLDPGPTFGQPGRPSVSGITLIGHRKASLGARPWPGSNSPSTEPRSPTTSNPGCCSCSTSARSSARPAP